MKDAMVIREIRNSRESEEGPLEMDAVLSALGGASSSGGLFSFLFHASHEEGFTLELLAQDGVVRFFLGASQQRITYIESQLTAHYPKTSIAPVTDFIPGLFAKPHFETEVVLSFPSYYPLKTYKDVKDVDLLSGVLGALGRIEKGNACLIQIWVAPASNSWRHAGQSAIANGIPDPNMAGRTKNHPQARIIEGKINQVGFHTAIRMVGVGPSASKAEEIVKTVASSFGVFTLGEGNGFILHAPSYFQKKKFHEAILDRSGDTAPHYQFLGSSEIATIWHPPGEGVSQIKNISWGGALIGEPPEDLPTSHVSEEEKKHINFFARTDFKNSITTFGIKKADRRKHMYIVGKTGTGKSTLIANMVINDMRNGEGVAVVDPHGDLVEVLLEYVPSFRVNDVAYFDPSDREFPFRMNPLEMKNPAHKELIASGIVSIFYKLYHYSWGPRLEYILRNSIMTLLSLPDATLVMVPELLTNEKFRERVVEKLTDPVLKNFWINEFGKMTPQLRSEATMPILNKVGQFLSSQTIRNIIGHPVSTINLESMMNEGKILFVNLSQGKLGEDNSSLLGSMIITKMQLAAMNRVYQQEELRKDYYLYVDEFQNFATNSFVKILSEARKYRLNLTLANQYIGQIEEEVQNAIFGNTGSLISFGVGATDARPLSREFGSKYTEDELVSLGNYQTVLKLSINNRTSSPFAATTLPLPRSHNKNREKVIRGSRERYGKKTELQE